MFIGKWETEKSYTSLKIQSTPLRSSTTSTSPASGGALHIGKWKTEKSYTPTPTEALPLVLLKYGNNRINVFKFYSSPAKNSAPLQRGGVAKRRRGAETEFNSITETKKRFHSNEWKRFSYRIVLYLLKCSFIAAAARRPSPIARITVAPPRTMSPPA